MFAEKYRDVRRRNYGWRFLSSCHTYFNGQLQEIQNKKTDEARIRYLFCHAEGMPGSKTDETLQAILPKFYEKLIRVQPVNVVESYVREKTTHFILERGCQTAKKIPETTLTMRSPCHNRHLQWMEENFKSLWKFDAILKTASVSVNYDARYPAYYLSFCDDCRAAIMKNNVGVFEQYDSFDTTIEREIGEAEWGKELYFSLNRFRWRLNRSNGDVSEIDSAFNELIEQVDVDPPNLDSAYLRNSEFHDAVINLRLQSIVIQTDWRSSCNPSSEFNSLSINQL